MTDEWPTFLNTLTKLPASIRGRESLDQLSNYWVLMKVSVPFSLLWRNVLLELEESVTLNTWFYFALRPN